MPLKKAKACSPWPEPTAGDDADPPTNLSPSAMEALQHILQITGFQDLEWRMLVMWLVVGVLLYLAVFKQFEPLLLVPIAFGALLANLPTEKLVNRPAGSVFAPDGGTVVYAADWAQPGESIILPRVLAERPGSLGRFTNDPEGLRDLFRLERHDHAQEQPRLLFIIRADPEAAATREDGVQVTLGERTLTVFADDEVVWANSAGKVTATPVSEGDTVVAGQIILRTYTDAKPGLFYFIGLGIALELFPPLIFLGVGALTDFGPLIANPRTFLLGAAAQIGIFLTFIMAMASNLFSANEAAAIAIIGGADGPTSIFLANSLAPELLAPIAVAAYSYMALVPIIQPPIIRLLTTKKEREIDMPQARPVSKTTVVLFPLITGLVASLAIPTSAPLIGLLMFGNLIRESGVTERLKKTAGGPMIDIVTILLGLVVGGTMGAEHFLTYQTIMILALGAVAFSFSTAGGVIFAKAINLFLRDGRRINPCIGAAGVSAVPMSARVVQQFVSEQTEGRVNPLMPAMGPNVAGVVGSAVTAGVFLALLA